MFYVPSVGEDFTLFVAVLATVVAAASVRVVASGGPIVVVASLPTDHIVVILRLASVAEAVMH